MKTKTDSVTLARGTARTFALGKGEVVKIISPQGGLGGDFTFLGFDQEYRWLGKVRGSYRFLGETEMVYHFIFSIGFSVCGKASAKHLDN